jgi:predicted RNA polymerase sigma factor
LADYQPYHATRADLLARAGRREGALDADHRANELCKYTTEHHLLGQQRGHVSPGEPRQRDKV